MIKPGVQKVERNSAYDIILINSDRNPAAFRTGKHKNIVL